MKSGSTGPIGGRIVADTVKVLEGAHSSLARTARKNFSPSRD